MAASPSSQKPDARPVSFLLDDFISTPKLLTLYIRPEDLTRMEPSRIMVQQTLAGSPWADSFGPGITAINISGHTGWHRDTSGSDGIDRFTQLHDDVFAQWHSSRKKAVEQGLDPNLVALTFVDGLDDYSATVIPMQFTLKRSRTRPLLAMYQISMLVADGPNSDIFNLSADDKQDLGLDSLLSSIGTITSAANDITSYVDTNIAQPLQKFMNQTAAVYNAVATAVTAADNTVGEVINIATDISRAGYNVVRTIAVLSTLPTRAIARLSQIASAYQNVYCLLKNAIAQKITYPDYTPLYGSSNCSSTNGGSPLSTYADTNPFFVAAPTSKSPVILTNTAQATAKVIGNSDVALAPGTLDSALASMNTISNGITVSS